MSNSHEIVLRQRLGAILKQRRPQGGMAVINGIIEDPNASALIQAMQPEELHTLMQDIGWSDCHELLRYASEEQFQGLTAINAWVDREFQPQHLEALIGLAAAADPEAVERLFESFEHETSGLYLLSRVMIFNLPAEPNDQDEVRELGEVLVTPDNMFWLVFPDGDDFFPQVKYFIDGMYALDNLAMVSLLKTLVFEDKDTLQAQARQFRQARLRTMGFPALEETDHLLDYVNPVKLKNEIRAKLEQSPQLVVGQDTLLPALVDWKLGDVPFLQLALQSMGGARVRDEVVQGMAYLGNAVIVASSGGDLFQPAARDLGLNRAVSLMNLGLEFLSDKDPKVGARALGRVWPKTLFRIGHSRLLALKGRATKLARKQGTELGFNLFDPPLREVIAGCRSDVPQYFVGLDDESSLEFREFRCLEDVSKADVVLEQAEGIAEFCDRVFKLDVAVLAQFVEQNQRPMVTHTTLMATALVNGLRGADSLFQPVPVGRIPDVMDVVLLVDEGGQRVLNPRLQQAVAGFVSAERDPFAAALFDLSLSKLEDVFHRLPRGLVPEAKFMAGALLVE
jgi:hypothetical protein